jgi:hypothetical protein
MVVVLTNKKEPHPMTAPTAIKPPAPQTPAKTWTSARLSAVVEAAYLLEVANR